MFPTWRLKLREARACWQSGRYDEAGALLADESLREFLPAKRLAQDVAGKMVERAGRQFARGDSAAGWQDLATADRLGGQAEGVGRVRQQYAERGVAEARCYLAAGQSTTAVTQLEKLRRRGLAGAELRVLRQIATLMQGADHAAARGHFADAWEAAQRARELAAEEAARQGTMEIAQWLERRTDELLRHGADCQRLSAELHEALGRKQWGAVLSTAEALLAIAPQHTAAREARHRAWQAVGMDVTRAGPHRPAAGCVSLRLDQMIGKGGRRSTRGSARSYEDDTVTGRERPHRALLWVDAVGGFLVCLDDEVAIGQPSAGDTIAVPILADLSRRHVVVRRDQGCYILEPIHEVSIDGREVTEPVVLVDGQLIQLAGSVRLRFTKPHALSASARLVLESHHKTVPSADAVLLMADSCVLGPHRHCHVVCRNWKNDVVIYRQGEQMVCRSAGPLAVDGQPCRGATKIEPGTQVEGEDFSFTWETIV